MMPISQIKIIFTMNKMVKFLGLKNKIYLNKTEDIILQSHLNPEAQVFVPSAKVCISINKSIIINYFKKS